VSPFAADEADCGPGGRKPWLDRAQRGYALGLADRLERAARELVLRRGYTARPRGRGARATTCA